MLLLGGFDHELRYFRKRADGTLPTEIFEINPLGQVPVLVLPEGSIMTESAAILLHLADLAPHARLAPPSGSADRPAYLRLMTFMAANTYMTELRYFYPERYSANPDHAPDIKAKAFEEQTRNWAALEDMAATGEALLASGISTADLYLAMLVSWSEIPSFKVSWPKLHSIAARIAALPQLADVWQRNDVIF
jgi:glutathione S-transferase